MNPVRNSIMGDKMIQKEQISNGVNRHNAFVFFSVCFFLCGPVSEETIVEAVSLVSPSLPEDCR